MIILLYCLTAWCLNTKDFKNTNIIRNELFNSIVYKKEQMRYDTLSQVQWFQIYMSNKLLEVACSVKDKVSCIKRKL